MIRIAPPNETARAAIEQLRRWDFHMDADNVEPLLFTAWLREFAHRVFFRRLGNAAADYWDLKPQVVEAVLSGHPEWCVDGERSQYPHPNPPLQAGEGSAKLNPPPHNPVPNPLSPVGKGRAGVAAKGDANPCDVLLAETLEAALAGLRQGYGPDMAQWRWGRAHVAKFPNAIFDRISVLGDWLAVAIPTDGGFDTVNRGSTTIREDAHPYEQRFGAGLRIITDLAAPAESRMIAVPGQSGNPLSPHYADLVERWRRFDWLVPGRAAAISTLILMPR